MEKRTFLSFFWNISFVKCTGENNKQKNHVKGANNSPKYLQKRASNETETVRQGTVVCLENYNWWRSFPFSGSAAPWAAPPPRGGKKRSLRFAVRETGMRQRQRPPCLSPIPHITAQVPEITTVTTITSFFNITIIFSCSIRENDLYNIVIKIVVIVVIVVIEVIVVTAVTF